MKKITKQFSIIGANWREVGNILLNTWRIYPYSTLIALIGTGASVWLIQGDFSNEILGRLVWTLVMGFFLSVSVEMIVWQMVVNKWVGLWLKLGLVIFLVSHYFWLLPSFDQMTVGVIVRDIIWTGIFVLSITWVAVKKDRDNNGFWRHNVWLLASLAMTLAVSGVLAAGLLLAVGTVGSLFPIELDYHLFPQIWTMTLGIFGSLFFLTLTRRDDLINNNIFQLLVRIGQYIMIPLVAIYFIILYVYSGYVLGQGVWPEHTVAYMIIVFSGLGIFTAFFLYPLSSQSRWMPWLVRGLWLAIIPQVVVLFWAVSWPVERYGLTVNRYLVIVMGIWLLFASFYMLFGKSKNWRILVLSLVAVGLVSSTGPLSAMNLSRYNQMQRLIDYATRAGIMVDGQLQPPAMTVEDGDAREISDITTYLIDYNGLDAFQPILSDKDWNNIKASQDDAGGLAEKIVKEVMHISYYKNEIFAEQFFSYYLMPDTEQLSVTDIEGYNFAWQVNSPGFSERQEIVLTDGKKYQVFIDNENCRLVLTDDNNQMKVFDFTPFIVSLYDQYGGFPDSLPIDQMTVQLTDGEMKIKVVFQSFDGQWRDGHPTLDYVWINVYSKN